MEKIFKMRLTEKEQNNFTTLSAILKDSQLQNISINSLILLFDYFIEAIDNDENFISSCLTILIDCQQSIKNKEISFSSIEKNYNGNIINLSKLIDK